MKIYFACSITGGREYERVYQELIAALLADGHTIPTADLAKSNVLAREARVSAAEVYGRDVGWIRSADALVAEISVPSHGVGYEIGFALSIGKPVHCIYEDGRKISKMISGNPHPKLSVEKYQEIEGAIASVREFMKRVG